MIITIRIKCLHLLIGAHYSSHWVLSLLYYSVIRTMSMSAFICWLVYITVLTECFHSFTRASSELWVPSFVDWCTLKYRSTHEGTHSSDDALVKGAKALNNIKQFHSSLEIITRILYYCKKIIMEESDLNPYYYYTCQMIDMMLVSCIVVALFCRDRILTNTIIMYHI